MQGAKLPTARLLNSNLAASEPPVRSSRFDDLHRILALYRRESIRGKELNRASVLLLHKAWIHHGRGGGLGHRPRIDLHAFATVQRKPLSTSA